MHRQLYAIVLMGLTLILSACGTDANLPSSFWGVINEGLLPNRSTVVISANSFNLNINESTSVSGILGITGGSANSNYTIVFGNSALGIGDAPSVARISATDSNGFSVATSPRSCTLGATGAGLVTSCIFMLSISPSTLAGKYTIPLSARGSNGTITSLSPITVIVNGSLLSDASAITQFSINNVNAIISGQNINLTLPYATDPTALVASFVTTGSSVMVNNVVQDDGATANDFTNPVEYVVYDADGLATSYMVTVNILPGTIAITTSGFKNNDSIVQGGVFRIVAKLEVGDNNLIPTQRISVINLVALNNVGVTVTSSPSPCALSTPEHPSCTFNVATTSNVTPVGSYILSLQNNGSIPLHQSKVGFRVLVPVVGAH